MKTKRSGQSIIEVVFATTLIAMGVIAALSLTNQSQKSSNYAKIFDMATAYNNQVADYIRNQKTVLGYAALAEKFVNDSNSNVTTYCLANLPDTSELFLALTPGQCNPTTDAIPGTILVRQVTINTSTSASGILPLTVTTIWPDSTPRTATLKLDISRWK